jgi:membrane protein
LREVLIERGAMERGGRKPPNGSMRRYFAIALEAYQRFLADDGWAIASHIALSALMAMFPFFIVLTSLAGFFGSADLADEIANLLLATWPQEVARPLANEMHDVLTTARTGVFTLGVVLSVFFASSGVESLRIGLNRAYDLVETRNWIVLRLESIGDVLIAALALLALGFLVVLGPLLFRTFARHVPWVRPWHEATFTFFRFALAALVLTVALIVAHKWIPAGRRRMSEIIPGIAATLFLWLAAGVGFGRYLDEFSFSYVNTYAGLASAMMALVFLYWTATIFIYGGELNAARLRARHRPAHAITDDT